MVSCFRVRAARLKTELAIEPMTNQEVVSDILKALLKDSLVKHDEV